MKRIFTRLMVTTLAFVIAGVIGLWLFEKVRWFGAWLGIGGLIVWPGTVMASMGATFTWPWAAVVVLGLLFALCSVTSKKKMLVPLSLACAMALAYLLLGREVLRRMPTPTPPATPFEVDADQRAKYLGAYRLGYITGRAGTLRTYCFAPRAETDGFYDGMRNGLVIYERACGIRNQRGDHSMIDVMAARDGVTSGNSELRTRPSSVPVIRGAPPADVGGAPESPVR